MLEWALVFPAVSIIAGAFGSTGASAGIARSPFFPFLAMLVGSAGLPAFGVAAGEAIFRRRDRCGTLTRKRGNAGRSAESPTRSGTAYAFGRGPFRRRGFSRRLGFGPRRGRSKPLRGAREPLETGKQADAEGEAEHRRPKRLRRAHGLPAQPKTNALQGGIEQECRAQEEPGGQREPQHPGASSQARHRVLRSARIGAGTLADPP